MIYNNLEKTPGNLKDYLDKQLKRGKYSEAPSPRKCIYINQEAPADTEDTHADPRPDVSRKRTTPAATKARNTNTRKQQKRQGETPAKDPQDLRAAPQDLRKGRRQKQSRGIK